jgi:hypothetical protein
MPGSTLLRRSGNGADFRNADSSNRRASPDWCMMPVTRAGGRRATNLPQKQVRTHPTPPRGAADDPFEEASWNRP